MAVISANGEASMTPANFECKLRNILKDFGVTGKSDFPLVPETCRPIECGAGIGRGDWI